jgi:hypothetical protein
MVFKIIVLNLEKRIDRKNNVIKSFGDNNITSYFFYKAIDPILSDLIDGQHFLLLDSVVIFFQPFFLSIHHFLSTLFLKVEYSVSVLIYFGDTLQSLIVQNKVSFDPFYLNVNK